MQIRGKFPALKYNKTVHYKLERTSEEYIVLAQAGRDNLEVSEETQSVDNFSYCSPSLKESITKLVHHYVPVLYPTVRAKIIGDVLDTAEPPRTNRYPFKEDYTCNLLH